MKDPLLYLGSVMILTGLFGYTTVADDLRHPGELIAVSAMLLFGIALVAAAMRARRMHSAVPTSPALWAGALLTLLGIIGFGFVADDLTHILEFYISGAVLLTGIVLLVVAWRQHRLPSPR